MSRSRWSWQVGVVTRGSIDARRGLAVLFNHSSPSSTGLAGIFFGAGA